MDNIEYLLAKEITPSYTIKDAYDILSEECEINGEEKQLSRCMEEMAELIEVISLNNTRGRIDYVHLKEEIADCYICLEILDIIFNIQYKSDNPYAVSIINIGEPMLTKQIYTDHVLDNCILNLSTAITKISKCLRKKDDSELAIIGVVELVLETLLNVESYYDLNYNDISAIMQFKIARSQKRNEKAKTKKKKKEKAKSEIVLPDVSLADGLRQDDDVVSMIGCSIESTESADQSNTFEELRKV